MLMTHLPTGNRLTKATGAGVINVSKTLGEIARMISQMKTNLLFERNGVDRRDGGGGVVRTTLQTQSKTNKGTQQMVVIGLPAERDAVNGRNGGAAKSVSNEGNRQMKTIVLSLHQNETSHGCGPAKIVVANLNGVDRGTRLMTETALLLEWDDVSLGNGQNSTMKPTAKNLNAKPTAINEETRQITVIHLLLKRRDVRRGRDERAKSIVKTTNIHQSRIDEGRRQGIPPTTMIILSLERHEAGRGGGQTSNAGTRQMTICPLAQRKVVDSRGRGGDETKAERILDVRKWWIVAPALLLE